MKKLQLFFYVVGFVLIAAAGFYEFSARQADATSAPGSQAGQASPAPIATPATGTATPGPAATPTPSPAASLQPAQTPAAAGPSASASPNPSANSDVSAAPETSAAPSPSSDAKASPLAQMASDFKSINAASKPEELVVQVDAFLAIWAPEINSHMMNYSLNIRSGVGGLELHNKALKQELQSDRKSNQFIEFRLKAVLDQLDRLGQALQ